MNLRAFLLLNGCLALTLAGCDTTVSKVDVTVQPTAAPVAATPVDAPVAAQAVAVAAAVADPPKPLTDEELAAGWISLFDGQTLFGWQAHSKADWQVKDGAIVVTSGEKGLLSTSVQFDNYVLKCDFRAAKDTNSGLFLRTAPVVGMDDIKTKCYALNIAPPENPFPTGSFVGRLKGKAVPERAGEWQSFEVTLDGGKAAVKLNGEEVLAYDDPAPSGRGYIGLQLNSGQVEFKNIKLKPLGLESIFNGKDLTGWKNHPESKSTFTVRDSGELHVTSTVCSNRTGSSATRSCGSSASAMPPASTAASSSAAFPAS